MADAAEASSSNGDLFQAAVQALQAERLDEAADLLERVADLAAPGDPATILLTLVYLYQGDGLQTQGRSGEAVARYDLASGLAPQRTDVWNNRGVALEALGRLDEAFQSFDRAVSVYPAYAAAWFNRGNVLAAVGRHVEALASYDRALAIHPHEARYWNNRGLALGELNRWAEAADSFARAVALEQVSADMLANLSVAQRRLAQAEGALASADRALALQPDHPEALTTRGLALAAQGRFDAALESHDRALALRPAYTQALNNAGLALDALDRADEAMARFDAALAMDPGFAEAEFNSALTLLRAGRLPEGWRRHEARWRRKGEPGPTYSNMFLWLGSPNRQAIAGRTILLHAEQGLGDTLQFCRYVPLVKALGVHVVLEVQPPLTALLAGLDGVDQLIAVGDPVPAFDRHTPLLSLPLALDAAAAPPPPPYLLADPAREAAWRHRLPPAAGLRVGFVWAGNPAHANDANRSLPAAALAPLIAVARAAGAQTISLQKDVRADDVAWLDQTPDLWRVEPDLEDFADTAALAATCDLVISVDTAVAHLAGALGRPLWLLLPEPCDWRWMSKWTDTPWYPSARLFRQASPGGWAGVLDQVVQALAERLHR